MKKIVLLITFIVILAFSVSIGYTKTNNHSVKFPLPGESIANIKLQYDSYTSVIVAASTYAAKNCKYIYVVDTKVIKPPKKTKKKQGKLVGGEWTEEWTVKAGSKLIYVPIVFVLDERGATYIVSIEEVHL